MASHHGLSGGIRGDEARWQVRAATEPEVGCCTGMAAPRSRRDESRWDERRQHPRGRGEISGASSDGARERDKVRSLVFMPMQAISVPSLLLPPMQAISILQGPGNQHPGSHGTTPLQRLESRSCQSPFSCCNRDDLRMMKLHGYS